MRDGGSVEHGYSLDQLPVATLVRADALQAA